MGALPRVRWASSALRAIVRRPSVATALAAFGLLASAGTAWGRAEAEVAYTREQTFSAALRYLRVDLAYDVTEKDPDAAYLLFSFAAPELQRKVARGSIECRSGLVRHAPALDRDPAREPETRRQSGLVSLFELVRIVCDRSRILRAEEHGDGSFVPARLEPPIEIVFGRVPVRSSGDLRIAERDQL